MATISPKQPPTPPHHVSPKLIDATHNDSSLPPPPPPPSPRNNNNNNNNNTNADAAPWYRSRSLQLGVALLVTAVVGGAVVYHMNRRRKRGGGGAGRRRVLSRQTTQGTFPYLMVTVLNEQGKQVYEGNVMTFYGHPNDYVGLTPRGFELWDINTIFDAQNTSRTPLIFTRSFENARDDIWVPYFLRCPLKRMSRKFKIYTWDQRPLVVRIGRTAQHKPCFKVDGTPGSYQMLHYLDGKGRRRTARIEGTV